MNCQPAPQTCQLTLKYFLAWNPCADAQETALRTLLDLWKICQVDPLSDLDNRCLAGAQCEEYPRDFLKWREWTIDMAGQLDRLNPSRWYDHADHVSKVLARSIAGHRMWMRYVIASILSDEEFKAALWRLSLIQKI